MKALICGSFDPITNGHIDLIKRAAALFDDVTVGIFVNSSKSYMFTEEERLAFVSEAITDIKNAHAEICHGLVATYCENNGIGVIVKGIRNSKDYEYELEMAKANKLFAPGTETLFLPASADTEAVSSSMIKAFHSYGKDVSGYVPLCVAKALKNK